MLINKYLPSYHYKEFHSITINGAAEGIYPEMLKTDFSNSRIIKLLCKLRGMPVDRYTVNDLTKMGFIKLEEQPGKEIIYGMITKSPTFNCCQRDISPGEFLQKSEPSIIKA